MQVTYPSSTGRWQFDIHRLVVGGDTVVSEVTVTDGEQTARLVAFSEIRDGLIVHQVEYWPTPYDPQPGREAFTRPGERIP